MLVQQVSRFITMYLCYLYKSFEELIAFEKYNLKLTEQFEDWKSGNLGGTT